MCCILMFGRRFSTVVYVGWCYEAVEVCLTGGVHHLKLSSFILVSICSGEVSRLRDVTVQSSAVGVQRSRVVGRSERIVQG